MHSSTRKVSADSRRIRQAISLYYSHVNRSVCAVVWSGSHPMAQLQTTSAHSCSDCSSSLLVTHAKFGPLIVHITVNQRCDSDLDRAMSNSNPRNIISPRFVLVTQVLNLIFSPYFLIRGIFNDFASACMCIFNQRTHRTEHITAQHSPCSYARPAASSQIPIFVWNTYR